MGHKVHTFVNKVQLISCITLLNDVKSSRKHFKYVSHCHACTACAMQKIGPGVVLTSIVLVQAILVSQKYPCVIFSIHKLHSWLRVFVHPVVYDSSVSFFSLIGETL